ncbi:MAG TPA: FAD:protein FMN transferase [Acidimicrobiales bacterium]|nr:FAD:protein FMN transferase [Acidimicrobiales bacterium]
MGDESSAHTAAGVGPARTFRAIGTTISVLTVDPSASDAAERELRAEVDALDRACSRFRPDSEIAAVHAAEGAPVVVSPLLAELLSASLTVARFTAGLVDPTVGTVVESIGYDRDFDALERDGPAIDRPLVPAPGWRCIELDDERRLLRVPAGVRIDLGSSAKAFAADRAACAIAAATSTGVLVNLGGDIAVAGDAPDGGWLIGLAGDSSTAPERTERVVAIFSGGLASSGTGVRTWRRGNRALHHIVDPRTGDVAGTSWSLVSVVASTCLVANAASTAAIVLGEEALAWLERAALPARLVRDDGSVDVVAGWPEEPAGP